MKPMHLLTTAAALSALSAFSSASSVAQEKLTVVATTPDLAAIAREIGGALVDVKALAKPTEDPHYVDPKPSHIVTLNRADVLIEGGAELELGWLPPLLESSRNSRIAVGSPGRVVASEGIQMLDIPASFDRSKGDVHGLGNPHFLLDPLNAKLVAARIAGAFAAAEPGSAGMFQANLKTFDSTVDARLAEWRKRLEPYKGEEIVSYHKDFPYFARQFGLTVVETLEPKPGIAPSPAHLAKVIGAMKAAHAHVILVQPFQNRKTAETVARQTGALVLDFPQQPGVVKDTETYAALMDYLVRTLVDAFEHKQQ